MIRTLLFISLFVLQLPVKADEGLAIVAIGKAQAEKQKMTFIRLPDSENWNQEEQKSMNEFVALLSNDFSFYKKYFDVVSADSLKALQGVPDYGYWQGRGFNIVSKVEFSKQGLPAFKITS